MLEARQETGITAHSKFIFQPKVVRGQVFLRKVLFHWEPHLLASPWSTPAVCQAHLSFRQEAPLGDALPGKRPPPHPRHATSRQCHSCWLLDPWDTNVFLKSRLELSPSLPGWPLRPQVGPFLFFRDGQTLDQPGAGGPAGLEARALVHPVRVGPGVSSPAETHLS